jgi:hypothetical protein
VTERWLQKAAVFGVFQLVLGLALDKRLDLISLDQFIYPPLSLAISGL